jgi:hypothetical protein
MHTSFWGVEKFGRSYTTTVRISNLAELFIKTHMLKYFSIIVLFHDKDWDSEGELPLN